MGKFQVVVSNIGTVYDGNNSTEARNTYAEYVCQSEEKHGRASGESVALFCNGEIESEYQGKNPTE